MYTIDRVIDALIRILDELRGWINRIEDSWIEMPKIERFIEQTRNHLATAIQQLMRANDEWDGFTDKARNEILGSYSDIESWLNARQSKIVSWFEVRFRNIESTVRDVNIWLDNSEEWVETKVSEGIDNSKAKIEGIVTDSFEKILDRVFE